MEDQDEAPGLALSVMGIWRVNQKMVNLRFSLCSFFHINKSLISQRNKRADLYTKQYVSTFPLPEGITWREPSFLDHSLDCLPLTMVVVFL